MLKQMDFIMNVILPLSHHCFESYSSVCRNSFLVSMTSSNFKLLMYSWVMCEVLASGTVAAEKLALFQIRALGLGLQFLPNPSASAVSCVPVFAGMGSLRSSPLCSACAVLFIREVG